MARKCTFIALMVLMLTAAVLLSGAGASVPLRSDLAEPAISPEDFGDAPEEALAYLPSVVIGHFPTCLTPGSTASVVRHTNFGAFFGPSVDLEADGNGGACPNCKPPDQDECFADGDAGLLFPEPFTIDATPSVVPCLNSKGTSLGDICQFASWGANLDIDVTNHMPKQTPGFVNLLVDWNQDGQWGGSVTCPNGATVPEHALVDFPVPNGFVGPLSQLFPPNFLIGPNPGHVWARFTITERPVLANWTGEGAFEDGESEDYLLLISEADPGIKWSQLPNRSLPGLHAHDYLNATGAPESLTLADDWLCQGGEVTDLHWWGNYELDDQRQERRGLGIAMFKLSIHGPDPKSPCLPMEPPLWQLSVPFGAVNETDTGLVNSEGAKIYEYTYVLLEPFKQEAGGTYWFDLSAISVDIKDPPRWRWQETARTTNPAFPPNQCGAAQNQTPPGGWTRVIWAVEPPRYSEMAFEVTSSVAVPENDLGDAPDSSNTWGAAMTAYPPGGPPGTSALFPTVYQAGSPPYGPIHWQPQKVAWLGPAVTSEQEADVGVDQDSGNNIQPQVDAPDLDGADDGLILPLQLSHCVPATVNYTVYVAAPTTVPLYANVWFDWWRDGEWDDTAYCGQTPTPEWAVQNQALPPGTPAGPHVLTSPVFLPYNPLPEREPNPLWVRISLSEQRSSGGAGTIGTGGSGPQDGYQFGETEDYYIESYLPALDWGDAPDSPATSRYPTLSANIGARHGIVQGFMLGAAIDADPDGQPDAYAAGDDSDLEGDDEDGVTFLNPLMQGQQACVDVFLTNTTSPPLTARLYAWVDFDNNGAWDDSATSLERIFSGDVLSAGSNNLCFTVPAAAAPGPTYARFRLGSSGGIPPQGWLADGEVEDYAVRIEEVKWAQPPELNPESPYPACYWGWDEQSIYGVKPIVADDWPCTDDRPVTDIHWWGSYGEWRDEVPPASAPDSFHIGIWTDVPSGGGAAFSHPGQMIWQYVVTRAMLGERYAGCDFHPAMMQGPDSCFEYHLSLPEEAWFHQQPGENKVYWLSIAALYKEVPANYRWGWKTRPHYFNDDAVRIFAPLRPELGSEWKEGEQIMLGPESWDLAFVLTTEAYDFGDAQDPSYPTRLSSNGARHVRTAGGPFLGRFVDAEPDGQPDGTATGDDSNGLSDEDGVFFYSPLMPGEPANIAVSLAHSPAGCYVTAWIDYNRDGGWDDSPASKERIITDVPVSPGPVPQVLPTFTVPKYPTSVIGMSTARIRCSSVAGLGPVGSAPDGEVEDHRVQIMAPPAAPDVSIAIVNTDDVQLSWPPVADIYGNTITVSRYWIYRATHPYDVALPAVDWKSGPFPPGNITWDDADKVGNPATNYFYTVQAMQTDINGFEAYSARSNEVAEFDFALVPGSP